MDRNTAGIMLSLELAAAAGGFNVDRFKRMTWEEIAAQPNGSMDAVVMDPDGSGAWCVMDGAAE